MSASLSHALACASAALLGCAALSSQAEECNLQPAEVFERVAPSTAQVIALVMDPFSSSDRVRWSQGSGIVLDEDLILTNSHVIHGSRKISTWVGADRPRQNAELVGEDPVTDLAVLRVEDGIQGAIPARFREHGAVRVGESVVAIGNSLGLGKTVSHGIVSGMGRHMGTRPLQRFLELIQTDAAVNPGNSGGPLVDACARVVGVNTLRIGNGNVENVAFAVPTETALSVAEQLKKDGRVIRPWHGINGQLVPSFLALVFNIPLHPGFLIETIEPGSPAERLGLLPGTLPIKLGPHQFILGGDILLGVNGIDFDSEAAVQRVVASLSVGEEAVIRYWREGEIHEVKAVLPERPVTARDYLH